jgi:hypothetical protein
VRTSDRWVTPAVVVTALLCGTLVVLSVAGCVTYLTARGIDPDPMLRLVAQVATGLGSLGTLVLQLVTRRTTSKVERNTGVLATAVYDVADALPRPVPRHAHPETTEVDMRGAPGPRGSLVPAKVAQPRGAPGAR